ncbi:MAG TPA: YkgJ family cysteine cluster protein [Terracidiphilus sp.]|nr:YkgJ family cysteine cluster protein [Terracidiphilus sp.]
MAPSASDAHQIQVRDSQLVHILDTALAQAAQRAGPWLACRPGCTQCCHGAFAINALDALRLRTGMQTLHAAGPAAAQAIEDRASDWLATYGPDFPGDRNTGLLGTSDEDQARFDDFANDAPCPALNPSTGLCDVYAWRPMTCRVFGPPTRPAEDEALACCELCFNGATEREIAACEMPVPHQLETELLAQTGRSGETLVAFALLP